MKIRLLVALGLVIAVALGCSPRNFIETTPLPSQKAVGQKGGEVSTSDGSKVSLPPEALPNEVTISLTPAPGAPVPPSSTVVGTPVTFGPEGQQFTIPVTVTLTYDPAKLPAGRVPSEIVIFTAPAGSSSYTPLTTRVVDDKHVAADTTHFSTLLPALPDCTGGNCGTHDGSGDGGSFDAVDAGAAFEQCSGDVPCPSGQTCISGKCGYSDGPDAAS